MKYFGDSYPGLALGLMNHNLIHWVHTLEKMVNGMHISKTLEDEIKVLQGQNETTKTIV